MRYILITLVVTVCSTACKKDTTLNPGPVIYQYPEGLLAAIGQSHTDTIAIQFSTNAYNILPYSYTCNFNTACNFERDRDRLIIQQSGNVVQFKRTGQGGKYLKYNVVNSSDWDNPGQYILKKTIGFTTQLSDSTNFILTKFPNSNNFSLEPALARGNFLRIVIRRAGSGWQGNLDFVTAGTENTMIAF